MPGHARRSRLVALGLSVGGLAGLVTGIVLNEHPVAQPAAGATTVTSTDPFTAGAAATPASDSPFGHGRRTITSAS